MKVDISKLNVNGNVNISIVLNHSLTLHNVKPTLHNVRYLNSKPTLHNVRYLNSNPSIATLYNVRSILHNVRLTLREKKFFWTL